MLGIWADDPANEYIEEEVFQVMEAFANHNKDYFMADFTALRKAVATVPTDLDIYTHQNLAQPFLGDDSLAGQSQSPHARPRGHRLTSPVSTIGLNLESRLNFSLM